MAWKNAQIVTAQNRYNQLIESIFFRHYREGMTEFQFQRDEIEGVAVKLGIKLPKNLGDIVYSFRYRANLPERIRQKAAEGHGWIIRPAGRGIYKFVSVRDRPIIPNAMLAQTKVPDATPGIISRYALSDEQALLARVRYNRLIDIFTGVTCYSLQNHLRTTVKSMGQVETDEIYVGIDRRGVQYVFPVQAKGGTDKINIVQMEQDFAVCAEKFPQLLCRAIAAQFMEDQAIALFGFEMVDAGVVVTDEKHYRLVEPDSVTEEDLAAYRARSLIE